MVLSKQDSTLFFKLWLPLLRYGSETYDLHAGKLLKASGGIDLTATLLPFKSEIITDGLVSNLRVAVGPGIRQELKDANMRAKALGGIRKTLA